MTRRFIHDRDTTSISDPFVVLLNADQKAVSKIYKLTAFSLRRLKAGSPRGLIITEFICVLRMIRGKSRRPLQ
jgi:hypothetical protein